MRVVSISAGNCSQNKGFLYVVSSKKVIFTWYIEFSELHYIFSFLRVKSSWEINVFHLTEHCCYICNLLMMPPDFLVLLDWCAFRAD